MTLLTTLALLVACGGKKAPVAAPAAAAETPAVASGDFPNDAATRGFVQKLTSTEITNFTANDAGGAKVVLSSVRFSADNTWKASGFVDAGEERMDCVESGTWTSDPAVSPAEATITWVIGATDCIGRDKGYSTRALITIDGDRVDIALR